MERDAIIPVNEKELFMSYKKIWVAALVCAGICTAWGASPQLAADPYGVCCHVTWGKEERRGFELLYSMMKKAGISWVRSDLKWSQYMAKDGTCANSTDMPVIAGASEAGLNFLPILGSAAPDYFQPWGKHQNEFAEYVRFCAEKYRGVVKYWEIVNEPNAGGPWLPNADEYPVALKNAYQALKAADAENTVLYGGTALVPIPWIERTFQLGAAEYFDAMNVHTYVGAPEDVFNMLLPLRELMKKYGVGDKPIWITETGLSSIPASSFYAKALPAAIRYLKFNPARETVAILSDPDQGYRQTFSPEDLDFFPGFKQFKDITFAELKKLDPDQYPLLVPVSGEDVPADCLPDLLEYLKKGGTLILPSWLPFYSELHRDQHGVMQRRPVGDLHMKAFHIAWDAWWTNPKAPSYEKFQRPAPGFEDAFDWVRNDCPAAGRFLTDKNLHPGDRFIPVVEAGNENYTGAIAAIYQFNSELKGNIIAGTLPSGRGASLRQQAQYLTRVYLCCFAEGVERVFWYNFRNNHKVREWKESHYGLIDADNKPKPAYQALLTLTQLLPGGSSRPHLTVKNNVYLADWTRPDGVKTWALWSAYTRQSGVQGKLEFQGDLTSAVNFLGEKMEFPENKVTVTGDVLFLVGPEKVIFTETELP